MEEGPGNDIRAKPLREKLREGGGVMEKDQLPSSLIDRFLLRINEWIEELRMKGLFMVYLRLSI